AHYLGHRNLQPTARYTALAPDRFKGSGRISVWARAPSLAGGWGLGAPWPNGGPCPPLGCQKILQAFLVECVPADISRKIIIHLGSVGPETQSVSNRRSTSSTGCRRSPS